jgi:tRNA(Ile)-lysidine synthase
LIIDRLRTAILPHLEPGNEAPFVVAVSGGLDSCVLLHFLRFGLPERPRLAVAHLDHGMRPGSGADADWVAGLCRAWDVGLYVDRADPVPTSENEARSVRYAFLHEVCRTTGARALLTAHHADDQAETVLFRILRGTGLDGLRGIADVPGPGTMPDLVRPLLGFWREELEAYAAMNRIEWRDDPTNLDHGFARNAIRLRILPDAEALVAPAARRALVRLSELAAREEVAWAEVMTRLMTEVNAEVHRRPDGRVERVSFDRVATAALGSALRGRLLRWLGREAGIAFDADATRRAVDFAEAGRSGRAIQLGRGATLRRSLDRLEVVAGLERALDHPPDGADAVTISGPGTGRGVLAVGDRSVEVRWEARASGGGEPSSGTGQGVHHRFYTASTDYPLHVRGLQQGDRIRLRGGSRKVKNILLDARIPLEERKRTVLVADANGDVVWIPRLAWVAEGGSSEDSEALMITVTWPAGGADERS